MKFIITSRKRIVKIILGVAFILLLMVIIPLNIGNIQEYSVKASESPRGLMTTTQTEYTITIPTVTVAPTEIKTEQLICNNTENQKVEVKEGKTWKAEAAVIPSTVTNQTLEWSTSDSKVASVNTLGVITAKKVGSAKITAKSTDGSNQTLVINVNVYTKKRVTYKKGFYYEPISSAIKKRISGISYKKNKNISYSDLKYVIVQYVNFAGVSKQGELIVNKVIAKDIVQIFYELYQAKYPIARMVLVDEYGANDNKSMKANNTSAFNYRIMDGTNILSQHAYGLAIDINPVQNPFVSIRKGALYCNPIAGKKYADRSLKSKGMIIKGDLCYKLFKKHGFLWGGEIWKAKDYQHFHKVLK